MENNTRLSQHLTVGFNVKSMPTERVNTLQNSKLKKIATSILNDEMQSMAHLNYSRSNG